MAKSKNAQLELTFATLAYVGVIAYGTLFSSEPWRVPNEFQFLAWGDLRTASRADMIENVFGYIPLGLLLAVRLVLSTSRAVAITATVFVGFLLSLSLEVVQVFVPSRDSSALDLMMNTIGALAGAIGSVFLDSRLTPFRAFLRVRDAWFVPGLLGNLGASAVLLWVASQVSPFIPTIDVATVRQGLSGAWHTLQDPASLNLLQASTYSCYLFALGVLWSLTVRERKAGVGTYVVFALVVLLAKPFFLAREFSLEALVGLLISVPIVAVQSIFAAKIRAVLGAAAIVAGFTIYELTPEPGPLIPFNWVPFVGEITNTLNGIMGMTALVSVFFLLGALTNILAPSYQRREYAVAGGFFVALFVGLCEWSQQFVPGRHGDITTVGIALVGWGVAWRFRDASWGSGYAPVVRPHHRL